MTMYNWNIGKGIAKSLTLTGDKTYTGTYGHILRVGTNNNWVSVPVAGGCGIKAMCDFSATSGDNATLRLRGRSSSTGAVQSINASASAVANNYGNLTAIQGYAQPNAYTQNGASNIVCGVYSCIDATTTSSGRRWSTWIDDHSTTKAAAGHYLLRMSDNGTTTKDGAITVYSGSGRLPVFVNFEDTGCCNAISSAAATVGYQIVVRTPNGSLGYVNVYSASGT